MKKATLAKYLGKAGPGLDVLALAEQLPSPIPARRSASSKTAMVATADLPSPALARGSGRFPGSKGGAGVWQRIISEMPPHELYVEAFAGTGQVLLKKRPARASLALTMVDVVPGPATASQPDSFCPVSA